MAGKALRKTERREQLLEAALRAFGKRGYHDTQISHIIAEAKVARGTFYLYFKGKREIFDEIIAEITDHVLQNIHPIDKKVIQYIPKQIFNNIERVTKLLLKNPHYIKIFFNDAVGLDEEFDSHLKKFYQKILKNIQTGLRQGQELGIVRTGKTQVLSLCLLGCLKEIYYQHVLGTLQPNAKEIVQGVYQFVLHAVVKPGLIPAMMES